MDLVTLLKPLERLEQEMGKLYEWYAELFAADQEASGVFFRLALEEQRHARMVDHVRRLVRQNNALSTSVEADLSDVDDVLDRLARIRSAKGPLEVATAVRLAIELEQNAAEAHYRHVIAESIPEVSKLLQALTRDDRTHQARLEKLAMARGL
jgi:rubrerythrin